MLIPSNIKRWGTLLLIKHNCQSNMGKDAPWNMGDNTGYDYSDFEIPGLFHFNPL